MLKTLVVDPVFDSVAAISSRLESLLWFLAGNDQDLMAWLLIATCCLAVLASHSRLVRQASLLRSVLWLIVPLVTLVLTQVLISRTGASFKWEISPDRIEKQEGLAYRAKFKKEVQNKVAGTIPRVCRVPGVFSLEKLFLVSRDMRESARIKEVVSEGRGLYRTKEDSVWLSTPDGTELRAEQARYFLVCDQPWRRPLSIGISIAYIILGIALTGWRFQRGMGQTAVNLVRDWRFLALAGVFLLYFGGHQLRFLHQDHRMQLVTSRDDDGYMMERLMRAKDLLTMDPNVVQNDGYASIGYYPFAALSYGAGKLGLPLSVELLNIYVRGLKTLMSLGMLAAVWLLGRRHFSTGAAVFATAALMTNLGFLQYSSYPFYPDVLMAAASTVAISQTLVLAGRWSDRAFFLAVLFATLSVAIKFITFLLFPLLAVVAAWSIWMEAGRDWRRAMRFALERVPAAVLLCGAVYFICNPYLRYNFENMVPNWKDFYGYYAIDTPFLVAGAPATLSSWVYYCYSAGKDHLEAIFAALATVALVVFCILRLRRGKAWTALRSFWHDGIWRSLLIMMIFSALYQAYLLVSVTLPESIDARMILPILPLLYIVVAIALLSVWKWLSATDATEGRALAPASPGRKICLVLLLAGSAWLLWPRMGNLWAFQRVFGRVPDQSEVVNLLDDWALPASQRVLTSLQSYIPKRIGNLTDGQWRTEDVYRCLFQQSDLPGVFIEDESYYNQFFSKPAEARGFHTEDQKRLHAHGHELYTQLRAGQLAPFFFLRSGTEILGTNDTIWTGTRFHAFASRFAFAENLASPTGTPPASGVLARHEWPRPTTLSCLHISTDVETPPGLLQARFRNAQNAEEIIAWQGGHPSLPSSTEHFITFDPPREILSVEVFQNEAQGSKATLRSLQAIGPLPISPNPASSGFKIAATGAEPGATADWDRLVSIRPGDRITTTIAASAELNFSIESSSLPQLNRLLLVLDGTDPGPLQAECICHADVGSTTKLPVAIQTSLNPDHVAFVFASPKPLRVKSCELRVHNPSSLPVTIHLRQLAADILPDAPP